MNDFRCLGCMELFDISISNVCPHCGYVQSAPKKKEYYLNPGFVLANRYIIGRALGSGGFGVTYIAWDSLLQHKVAIKEYMPADFSTRAPDQTTVYPYGGEKMEQFEAGLKSFVEEAMRLAKLNHLNGIVHIYDSIVENSTGYIIMEYLDGETMADKFRREGKMPYQEVVDWMVPVLNSLQEVHNNHIVHRDIAPDNIIKTKDGKIKLIDFGAARYSSITTGKQLSVVIKPGYAPEEQYRTNGMQGPWTDVYAIGAVMYHMITGKLPTESLERQVNDTLQSPRQLGIDIPEQLDIAIMNALNVRAEYRIKSAKEFADVISGYKTIERVAESPRQKEEKERVKWSKPMVIATSIFAAILIAAVVTVTVLFANGSLGNKEETTKQTKSIGIISGMTIEEANEKYKKYNIKFEEDKALDNDTSEKDKIGTIIPDTQNIDSSESLTELEGETIKVGIYTAKDIALPKDVIGKTEDKAKAKLKDSGYFGKISTKKEKSDKKDGTVLKVQYKDSKGKTKTVKVGDKMPCNVDITLVVSTQETTTTTTTTKQNTTYKNNNTERKSTTKKKTTTKAYYYDDDDWDDGGDDDNDWDDGGDVGDDYYL